MKRHALIYFGVVFIHLLLAMCLKMKCVSFISSRFFFCRCSIGNVTHSSVVHVSLVIFISVWSRSNLGLMATHFCFLISTFTHSSMNSILMESKEWVWACAGSYCRWIMFASNSQNIFKFSISVFNSSKEQLLEIHAEVPSHFSSLAQCSAVHAPYDSSLLWLTENVSFENQLNKPNSTKSTKTDLPTFKWMFGLCTKSKLSNEI